MRAVLLARPNTMRRYVSKFLAVLHSEVVGVYGSLNAIVAWLVVLNVVTLTPDQIAAVIGLVNVVLAPIVRALVTPTSVRPAVKVSPGDILPGGDA